MPIAAQLIHAFSLDHQTGNPSYVIATQGDRPDLAAFCVAESRRRQCEVTHLHFPASAASPELHFYVESGPMAFCGHGTLAAAAMAAFLGRGAGEFELKVGHEIFTMKSEEGGHRVAFRDAAAPLHELTLDGASLRQALGLPASVPLPVRIMSGGRKRLKLLLEMASPADLAALAVDPALRDALCRSLGLTGIYCFHRTAAGACARHFPLAASVEDMATGNIAATLAAFLCAGRPRALYIDQGGPACNKARLEVRPEAGLWWVGGQCRWS